MKIKSKETPPQIKIEKITEFKNSDLSDLCDATESTIKDNESSFLTGIGRAEKLARERLEAYWNGVLLVPERVLIIGRLDGVIASSIQLVKPAPNEQNASFAGKIESHFVAPWARGHGLAKELLKLAEKEAKNSNLEVIRLSVRSNLEAAIKLYETNKYKRWGELDKYEKIDDKMFSGYFYYKDL